MPSDSGEVAEKIEPEGREATTTENNRDGDSWIKGLSFRAERWLCLFLHIALFLGFLVLTVLSDEVGYYVGEYYLPNHQYGGKDSNTAAVAFGASTVPLFIGLMYTAVLVGFTQRLSLRNALMSSQRLVVTHDKANAWFGLGACAGALRRQFQVRSSILGILLITLYLGAITVVHTISGSIFYVYYFPKTAWAGSDPVADADWYKVWVYTSEESAAVGIAASFFALVFCGRLTRTPSKADTANFEAVDEADKLYTFGLLQVIRLIRNKPEVQARIGEAEDSSDSSLRRAAKGIEIQLMGAKDIAPAKGA